MKDKEDKRKGGRKGKGEQEKRMHHCMGIPRIANALSAWPSLKSAT